MIRKLTRKAASAAMFLAALCLGPSLLHAAPVWTTGSTSDSGFSPAANNIIAGMAPSEVSNGNAGAEGTGGADKLTDGLYGSSNAERYTIGNNAVLEYDFGMSCLLSSVHFYSQWNDTGRDDIAIASIEVQLPDDSWETIANSSVSYGDASYNCFAKLSDPDTGFLAPAVKCLRINFAAQENGYVGYLEIEAVGRPADFAVANPVTGSADYVSAGALVASAFPALDDAVAYQFTESADSSSLDPSAWKPYTVGVLPSETIPFTTPANSGDDVTVYAWFLRSDSTLQSFSDKITYLTSAPTAAAKAVSIPIDSAVGTLVTPAMIDDGSADAACGIYSMSVSPSLVFGTTTVTLTVMNNAGVTATATAQVSPASFLDVHISPVGDDTNGDGTAANPWATLNHALANLPAGGTVYLASGTYPAAGESYPYAVNGILLRREPADSAPAILDGANGVANLFTVSSGTLALSGLTLQGTTDELVYASTSAIVATNCVFTQTQANRQVETTGAVELYYDSSLEAVGCSFTNMSVAAVIRCTGEGGYHGGVVTLRSCLVADNTVGAQSWYNDGSLIFTRSRDGAFNFYDTVFRNNSTYDARIHDSCMSPIAYADFTPLDIDRCQFLGNTGGNLFGICYSTGDIRNSLFADNVNNCSYVHGYNSSITFRNCTFVRGSGGFTAYNTSSSLDNCIVYGLTALNRNDDAHGHGGSADRLTLSNTLIYDTPLGLGYYEYGSVNVTTGSDPLFSNAATSYADAGFDVSLLPYSPAIDAGDNTLADGDTDIAGNARIADNNGDSSAVVDLGCYESLFGAAVSPTFQVPVPGSLSGYRGVTYPVPVTISPAASGPVTADVSYGAGVSGPQTLYFADGAGPVTLNVTIDAGNADSARITLTDSAVPASVLPANLDVFMDDIVITTGGTNVFMRAGSTVDIPVSLALEGAVAPGDVSFSLGSVTGDGTGAASWTGGDAVIPAGYHSSTGTIHIVGGVGINEVTITSGSTFAETGANSVTLRIIGYPGYLYVDPANGDDDAIGTADDPLKTIAHALAFLSAGDEVRLLPGTYDSTTQTLPITPGGVAIVGCDANGDPAEDNTLCVIDGANSVSSIVAYSLIYGSTTGRVANVWLRNSVEAAISCGNSDCVASNVFVTQTSGNSNVGGAIHVNNVSHMEAIDCCFSGIVRRATVWLTAADGEQHKSFTARRTTFIDNYSNQGGIGANEGGHFTIALEDCDFIRNGTGGANGTHDAGPGSIAYLNNTHFVADRCRFLGNTGNHLIGLEYNGSCDARIQNSLLVENSCSSGAYGAALFLGYSGHMDLYNCTMLRNSGVYAGRAITCQIHNSIIDGDSSLSSTTDEASHLTIFDSIVRNIGGGQGYNKASSSNVTDTEPTYENAAVSWSAPGFDARPRPYSPTIDAGDNASVYGAAGLGGDPRIADNTESGTATVDLGCYESAFHAAVEPTFLVPLQGSLAGFRGNTYSIPVSISPAAAGPVTAAVTYGAGLSGPATLAFESGDDTVELAITVSAESDATFARVTITESGTTEGVLPGIYDVFMDDLVVTVGGNLNFFVGEGRTLDIPVSIALEGALAPSDVAVFIGSSSGEGTSTASWQGGDAVIPEGYHSSTGAIHVVGGQGVNTLRVSSTATAFVESNEQFVDIAIVAHPGYLYVDPVNGDNANHGTVASPLRTIAFAASVLDPGDEVRLLPGTYTSATEVFPLRPEGVAIVGCDANGDPAEDPTLCVIDCANAENNAIAYDGVAGANTGRVENVWLRETTTAAIQVEDSHVVVNNSFFTQTYGTYSDAGGIRSQNDSVVEIADCCFSGMVRRAAVWASSTTGATPKSVVVRDSSFLHNEVILGAVGFEDYNNQGFTATISGCDFIGNIGHQGNGLPDAWSPAALYVNDNAATIDRCRFLGNGGNQLIGMRNGSLSIANSLFAGNSHTVNMFRGWNIRPPVANCTFVGNTGSYDGYGFAPYFRNCIFFNDAAFGTHANEYGGVYARDTMVYGAEPEGGYGYTEEEAGTVVTGVDPLLKNATVAWNAEGFDAHLLNSSPAIDAGNSTLVIGDLDLDGTARLKWGHTHKDGLKVDLGCYEADVPTAGTILLIY